jgi:hypothetical protein
MVPRTPGVTGSLAITEHEIVRERDTPTKCTAIFPTDSPPRKAEEYPQNEKGF